MGKKKSVRKFYPNPKYSPAVDKLLTKLDALTADQQQEFVNSLRDSLVLSHPCVARLLGDDDETLQREIAKRPKKRGNPDRDAIILRLADSLSDSQIARHPEVVAANDGERMKRQAVQAVRLRKGKKKR